MERPKPGSRPVLRLASTLIVAALAFGLVRWAAQDRGATTSAPTDSAYPGPTAGPATATPPALGGLYPPPGIPHEVVSLHDLPAAAALAALGAALENADAAALAALQANDPLALDPLGDTEGFGVRLRADEVQSMLGTLFAAGSTPVIQGAFGPGCLPREETCAFLLVVTGFEGTVAFPTRSPLETIGQQPPDVLPTGAAVWELVPDSADGLWWRSWRVADGYHQAVEHLASTHGVYYVIR